MEWIILPNTLHYDLFANNVKHVWIIEDPWYFNKNFNRLKLVFHRASMKYFEALLRKKLPHVKINYGTELPMLNRQINIYDPIDKPMLAKLKKYYGQHLVIHESPNFLLTRDQLDEYYQMKKNNKIQQHHVFYQWHKEKLGELVGVKSYDAENRKRKPKDIEAPLMPDRLKSEVLFLKEAEEYIAKKFKIYSRGPVEGLIFPISHNGSKKQLQFFAKKKLKMFGQYQDFVDKNDSILFHSGLSPMMNVGLITTKQILKEIQKYKSLVPIASYEGFIRQIIGWREYVRYMYIYFGERMQKSNFFGNTRKLNKDWYPGGSTGIQPVDDSINTGWKLGYLHHIPRLMIMCNFMNLSRIHPKEIYRWFMEFSVDSYEWVMVPNIYGMGTYADGGLMMRKPYLSSSKYILRMSNYSKRGQTWPDVWDKLYREMVKAKNN
jgi:deoxyribodipyrimidine photolyase-related protein